MKIEIEIKAKCKNLPAIKKSLKRLNAKYVGTIHQVDTYFLLSPNDRCKGAPRLRVREDINKKRFSLEYHNPIDKFKAKEYEVGISDPKMAKTILKQLGYLVEAVIDKIREKYTCRGLNIDIDKVKGLGQFIEVECMKNKKDSLKNIYDFFEAIGVSKKDLIPESRYLDMTWEKCKK